MQRLKRRKIPQNGKFRSGCNKVVFHTPRLIHKSRLTSISESVFQSLFRESLSGMAVRFSALLKARSIKKIV